MTVLSISEAARRCGVARTTLQRAIRAGCLALDARHEVSLEALGKAGYHAARTPQDAAPPPQYRAARAQQDQKADVIPLQQEEVLRSMQRLCISIEAMQDSLSAMQQGAQQLCDWMERLASGVQQGAQQATQQATQAPGSHAVVEHRASDGDTPTSAKEILIAQIQRWQQGGMSLRAIAHKLNTEGVPTWSGKGKWYESNLSRALAARRKTPQAHQAGAQSKE
jgi:hypothetical protein